MELTPRLRKVAQLVPPGARFADIGTDHAYLPTWLILNGVIDHAIAADLRAGPLERARDTAERFDVGDRLEFRLCNGLSAVSYDEADTIAIAGMGGETIAHILSCALWTKAPGITLILQPMSSQSDLRQWLGANGYTIERECLVREEKTIYTIFLVKAGEMPPLSAAELVAGQQSRETLRGEYLELLIGKTKRALEGQRAAAKRNEESIEHLSRVLAGLREMKKEWDAWQL